jgi:serine/threonine protein kinase
MSDDLKGTTVNERFTLLERIGSGGMATVYRARDAQSQALVAIKVLSRDFLARAPREAERNLKRFKREAEILKLLAGAPHVVRFHEHGCSESGDWHIVMELIEGEQLRYYIGRGRSVMGIPTFLHLALHIIQGLREIHARNIVHRDLAPDNIIVTKDEAGLLFPKFLDFGIGKSLTNELEQVTQLLTIMGKPQYFSPEQARGLDLTFASDVYSLGVILYEMLTGYVPLEIHGIPDFRKIQKDPPIPLQQWREGQRVPEDCRAVIMRCLEKHPENRPDLDEIEKCLLDFRTRFETGQIADLGGLTGPTSDHTIPVRLTEVELKAGDLVNRYEIRSVLGRGGMGAVYLAWDPVLQREVAIKIATRVEEDKAKQALLREARASSALRSPNIVTIFDAGTEGGTPYIAMEYVDGPTLAEIIEEDGPLAGDTLRSIVRGVCEGLYYAHEQARPVIHRDLKPANILVSRHGPKITDFGIARVAEGRAGSGPETLGSNAGATEGTVATMSPEQANGQPVDHRSDIYSLGCVLYMAMTGRGPFQGNPIAIAYQHCTTKPEPPSRHNPRLEPRGLDAIVLRCLEKDPKDRYQSVAGILADLDRVWPAGGAHSGPWYRTRSGRLAAASLLVLLGALGWLAVRGPAAPPPVPFALAQVGTSLPEGRFVRDRKEPWFVTEPELALWTQAPAGSEVIVRVAPAEGEVLEHRLAATAAGLAAGRIPLPTAPGAASALYQVTVRPARGPQSETFTVLHDARDPRLEYRARTDGPWLRLEPVITMLRREDLALRARDEESGLLGPSGPEAVLDIPVGQAHGTTLGASWTAADEIEIRVEDRAGRGGRSTVRVVLDAPAVAEPSGELWTSAAEIELALALRSERFDLAAAPPLLGLQAGVGSGDGVALQPAPGGPTGARGRYLARIPLPKADGPQVRRHALEVRLDGRPLSFLREPLVIVQDTAAPALRLEVPARGAIAAVRLEAGGPEPLEPLVLNQGESLGALFRAVVDDGEGSLGEEPEILVGYGDRPPRRVRLAGAPASAGLPETDLPPGTEPFPVAIVARDRAGNVSELRFRLERRGVQFQGITANGLPARDGILYVRDPRGVEVEVETSNLAAGEELHLEVRDGASPLFERLAMTRTGDTFRAVIPDLRDRGLGTAARELDFFPTPSGGAPLGASLLLRLDTTPPTGRLRFGGGGDPGEGVLRAGRFPELVFEWEDQTPLVAEVTMLEAAPAGRALPAVRHESGLGPRGHQERLILAAPPGETEAARYVVEVEARDLAGNPAPARRLEIEIQPPAMVLRRVGAIGVVGRHQFLDLPFATASRTILFEVANAAAAGSYRFRASILPEGAGQPEERWVAGTLRDGTPLAFALEDIPGGRGTIALAHQEELGGAAAEPVVFDRLAYLVDPTPPAIVLVVNGEEIPAADPRVREDGIRVSSLDQVAIRIVDEGGFPENPIVAEGPLPRHQLSRRPAELLLALAAEADWQGTELRFAVQDRAGNRTGMHARILRAKDRPELRPLADAEGRPLVHLGPDLYGTRTPLVALSLTNEAPQVVGVRARVRAPGAAPVEAVLLPRAGAGTFEGTLGLPGPGLATLEFLAITSAGDEAAPFATRSVLLDSAGPELALLAPLPPEVGSPQEVQIRARDAAGVQRIEARAGTVQLPLEATGPEVWRLPAALLAAGTRAEVVVLARDRLDNSSELRLEVAVSRAPGPKAPDPPPPSGFDRSRIQARTGLEPTPVSRDWRNPDASPEFFLSRTEVTLEQFRRFATAHLADPTALALELRDSRSPDRTLLRRALPGLDQEIHRCLQFNQDTGAGADMPVRFVSAEIAAAFCFWAGGRLPSAEEWRAAAGRYVDPAAEWPIYFEGGQPRNGFHFFGVRPQWAVFGSSRGEGQPLPVSRLETGSPFGLLGMAGNLAEWVSLRGGAGTLGGSYKYKPDLDRRGPRIAPDREPNRESSDIQELGDTGIRVAWAP